MLSVMKKALQGMRRGLVFSGHGVVEEFKDQEVESVHIGKKNFEQVIDLLQDLDFDFLSMEQLIELAKNGFRHHKHWTHLSFDDGYQNNYDIVHPILRARNIPFSVFISTHHVMTGEKFYTFQLRAMLRELCTPEEFRAQSAEWNRKIKRMRLDEINRELDHIKARAKGRWPEIESGYSNDRTIQIDHLKELSRDPLVHIGSHNHHHIVMHDGLSADEQAFELETSKRILTQDWKVAVQPTYCYPNGGIGDFSARSVALTAKHYPLSFVSLSGYVDSTTHPQMIPRFWLSNVRRTKAILGLSLLGNTGLTALRRNPENHFRKCRPAV